MDNLEHELMQKFVNLKAMKREYNTIKPKIFGVQGALLQVRDKNSFESISKEITFMETSLIELDNMKDAVKRIMVKYNYEDIHDYYVHKKCIDLTRLLKTMFDITFTPVVGTSNRNMLSDLIEILVRLKFDSITPQEAHIYRSTGGIKFMGIYSIKAETWIWKIIQDGAYCRHFRSSSDDNNASDTTVDMLLSFDPNLYKV